MRFAWSDDQLAFRDVVRDVLAKGGTWTDLDGLGALTVLVPEAELEGQWSKGWQFSLSGPIYAGTNEIQRNVTAERVLGLPRR